MKNVLSIMKDKKIEKNDEENMIINVTAISEKSQRWLFFTVK